MFDVYELRDKMEYFDDAVNLFWSQWGYQSNFKYYHDCMLHSCNTESESFGLL
ncbi:hypothetical protein SAMN04487897_104168 [Paenibacillus sp. yr247]|nr:hypothetical protein SAMN04487897_104168 [Paenibacillus sp. yr247]